MVVILFFRVEKRIFHATVLKNSGEKNYMVCKDTMKRRKNADRKKDQKRIYIILNGVNV